MAEMHQLSAKLQEFDANVTPNLGAMESAKANISAEVTSAMAAYSSAHSGLSSSMANDTQGQRTIAAVQLLTQACEHLKKSLDGDIGSVISECKEVAQIIEDIKAKIQEGAALEPSGWEKFWNGVLKIFSTKWCQNDQAKIDRLNAEIDQLNKAGEAQISAIKVAASGVSLGIKGNMVDGGTLGAYVDFNSNYNFELERFKEENPADYGQSVLGVAACLTVGAVESVAKVVEGVADFGLTVLGSVTSLFGLFDNGLSKALTNAAKFDVVGSGMKHVYNKLDDWGMYSEFGKKVGNLTGSVVAHGVLWMIPGGALISSAAIAGNSAEHYLQEGKTVTGALLRGTASGVLTYAGGKILPGVVSKAGKWIAGTRIGQAVSSGISSFSKTGAGQVVGKIGNIATKPLQWIGKGMQKTASGVNNYLATHSGNAIGKTMGALAKTDAAITTGAGKLAGKVSSKISNLFHGKGAATPSGGASSTPSGGASSTPSGGASSTPSGGASSTPSGGASSTPSGGASSTPSGGTDTVYYRDGRGIPVTENESMFGKINDSEFRAYQIKNGINVPSDELLKKVGIKPNMSDIEMDILVTAAAKNRTITAREANLIKEYFDFLI